MTQKTIRKLLSRSEALSQPRGAFSDFHGKRGTLSRSDSLPPSAWFDLGGHVLEAVKWFSLPDALQICLTARSCVTQPLSPSRAMILCGICTSFCSLNLSGCETLNLEGTLTSRKLISVPQLPSSTKRVQVRGDGMEQGLLKQIEKMNFRTQMEVFYTAYSKVRLFCSP